jgi:hypothetical protein
MAFPRANEEFETAKRVGPGPYANLPGPSRTTKMVVSSVILSALVAMGALAVTDLRGRAEVQRTDSEVAAADHELAGARTQLSKTRVLANEAGTQVKAVVTSALETQAKVESTEASTSAANLGTLLDGFSISKLNVCLPGVVQALDQVAVGQIQGALSSLGAVATSCNAARPSGG